MCAADCIPQRHVLAIMGFLAILNAYTMRVSLSVAIVQMVGTSEGSEEDPNACPPSDDGEGEIIEVKILYILGFFLQINKHINLQGEFDWDGETVGIILSSFFWGYLITHLPGGILAEKWGGKYLLSLGILSTAFFTLISPVAAKAGSGWLIAVRVLMGLGEVLYNFRGNLNLYIVYHSKITIFIGHNIPSPYNASCQLDPSERARFVGYSRLLWYN